MRFDGKLAEWDEERGSGFITPLHGGDPLYVQASAFARDGRRPKVGESLTFELEPAGNDGRKRAVNVQRAGGRLADADRAQSSRPPERKRAPIPFGSFAIVVLLVAAGWFGYTQFADGPGADANGASSPAGSAPASQAGVKAAFRCDGRTRCSQMTSCEEAKFFVANCPGTEMDGLSDGVPCQQQWCTSGAAR